MTYNEVRGSGLAAVCPAIEEGTTNLSEMKAGSYKLQQLCMEPTKIWVIGSHLPCMPLLNFISQLGFHLRPWCWQIPLLKILWADLMIDCMHYVRYHVYRIQVRYLNALAQL